MRPSKGDKQTKQRGQRKSSPGDKTLQAKETRQGDKTNKQRRQTTESK